MNMSVRDLLLADMKTVRLTFNLNNQRKETEIALELLHPYTVMRIGTDFGSVEFEFSEEVVVLLLKLVNLLWTVAGTQIVLGTYVISSRTIPSAQAKTKLANTFFKQVMTERRLPVLEHLENYFTAESSKPNLPEDKALLTALAGVACCLRERVLYFQGQTRRGAELAKQVRNYLGVAQRGWDNPLFRGFCLSMLGYSYQFQGNNAKAQDLLREAKAIYVEIAGNRKEFLQMLDDSTRILGQI